MKPHLTHSLWLLTLIGALACSVEPRDPRPGFNFDASSPAVVPNDAGMMMPGPFTDAASAGGGLPGANGNTDAGGIPGGSQGGMDAARPDSGTAPGELDASAPTPQADASSDASSSNDASGGDAGTDASMPDGPFEACVRALKPKCGYADNEVACSSIMTAPIPLSAGGVWPSTELPQGPYGTYIEWNEGKAFANPESILEGTCSLAAATFGEPDAVTQDVLNLRGQQLSLYTIFRPACMKDGETYPVITWGNGTCGQSGGYGPLLATVASYGFVVIAPNSRWTNQGNNEMLRALDLAKALNADSKSIYYQKLNLDKVGAMGHSQGGMATIEAAKDPRVKAVIIWNGGSSAVKPFLAVTGDRDISDPTVSGLASQVNAAAQPGAWLFFHKVLVTGGNATGHLTLMMQPDRVAGPAVAWWKYMLNGDAEAKKMFVGSSCGLCDQKADFEYGQHNLP